MLKFECELCGAQQDAGPLDMYHLPDQKYCEKCNTKLAELEMEIRGELKKTFADRWTRQERNQMHIIDLCEWLYKNKYNTFKRYFGDEVQSMLIKAVGK